jgi:hypothetical protein
MRPDDIIRIFDLVYFLVSRAATSKGNAVMLHVYSIPTPRLAVHDPFSDILVASLGPILISPFQISMSARKKRSRVGRSESGRIARDINRQRSS